MASSSKGAVVASLAGNVAVALAKFAAAAVSGSAAMLTEAIHSSIDSLNEVFLLIGEARAARPPDASHPLGYGMEVYFWSFIVALMVFLLGGVLSIREGLLHILHPSPVASPVISLAVLAVAAVFEALALRVGYREFRRIVRGQPIGLWAFIRGSKDASLVSVLLENAAALIGIALAAAGVVGSGFLHLYWADGAASVGIGLLLATVALILANETRSLIAGEAVAPMVMKRLQDTLARTDCITEIKEIATLHLGPGTILVALTVAFRPHSTTELVDLAILDLTRCLKEAEGRVAHVYVRPFLPPSQVAGQPLT